MGNYASYPLVTSIASDDKILFHDDSANAEVLISFGDVKDEVLSSISIASLPQQVVIPDSAKLLIELGTSTNKYSLFSDLVMSIPSSSSFSLILAAIPVVTTTTDGLMIASDKIKLNAATSSNTSGSIVQRGIGGDVSLGVITATGVIASGASSFPSATIGTATVTGNETVGGDLDVAGALQVDGSAHVDGFITADIGLVSGGTVTAATQLIVGDDAIIVGSVTELQVGPSTAGVGRIKSWFWKYYGPNLTGGAPTEEFNVDITDGGFAAAPVMGLITPYEANASIAYLLTSGSTTATNARCLISTLDGTNLAAGIHLMGCAFAELV